MSIYINRVASKQYKFTNNGLHLNEAQRNFYEKNGFLLIHKLVEDDILDQCRQRFVDICNEKVTGTVYGIMKDVSLRKNKDVKGEFLISRVYDFGNDEVFTKYMYYKPIVDVVESIIGPNITAFHSMIVNKPPDSEADASRHPLHQDLHYFPFDKANSLVAVWTAMEKINEDNGCLFIVPGSHTHELYNHAYPTNVRNKAFHGVDGFENFPKLNLIMEKGDTVFFHTKLLHGSGPNSTKGFRKAISCHYADSNCNFIDVRGTIQEHATREVEEMGRIIGLGIQYVDIWKNKSKLVRGPPGNFQKATSHL